MTRPAALWWRTANGVTPDSWPAIPGALRAGFTAKLSHRFYETFGDEIANELVNWFNEVDATYRGDLRELNEQNFARFDAKLEQRLAESDAKWERRIAELRVEIQKVRSDLVKWMFMFWAPTAFAVLGIGVGVVTLLLRS